MGITETLRADMERTARHLACNNGIWLLIGELPPPLNGFWGHTIEKWTPVIKIRPGMTIGETYRVLLHESAHGLYDLLDIGNQRARELAANEQAYFWATSVKDVAGLRSHIPQDIQDMVNRLKVLRSFGKEKHLYKSANNQPTRQKVNKHDNPSSSPSH